MRRLLADVPAARDAFGYEPLSLAEGFRARSTGTPAATRPRASASASATVLDVGVGEPLVQRQRERPLGERVRRRQSPGPRAARALEAGSACMA